MAAVGIILVVTGAILAWGVSAAVDGVDLQMVGYIVMAGGALALFVAAIRAAGWWSRSSTTMQTERHVSPDGRHYVEETRSS